MEISALFHEGFIHNGFNHVSDLALSLGDKNFKGEPWNRIAGFLLQQEVAHLGSISVRNNDSEVTGKRSDLVNGYPQVIDLLRNGPFLSLLDQGVATKGNEQNWFITLTGA
jgi:hypothetical protein